MLPADVCSSTVSLDETSYVNPMQLILCRYTRTLSQVCISASNVFRLYVRSPAPGQKPLSDLLCLTMGNDKAFSGKPQGRGSYPPHTGLSPWIVRYSFMEAVAVKDSCSHAYPALLLLVPPFRGLLIGRTWLRHFSILSASLYYQHFFFFLSLALWVHKMTGAFFSEMSVVKRFPLSVLIHLTLAWCPLNGGKKKKKLQSWYLYLPVTYTISANKVLVITFSLACCPNRPLGNLAAWQQCEAHRSLPQELLGINKIAGENVLGGNFPLFIQPAITVSTLVLSILKLANCPQYNYFRMWDLYLKEKRYE